MSDDETRPTDPAAPVPPPSADAPEPPAYGVPGQSGFQPPYAMPLPAGYPAYAAQPVAQDRPRFADQVLGMRAVVAVAIACLIIGGLSGFILGHAAGSDGGRFGGGPGFMQRGTFPGGTNGFPNGPNGNPNQQFGQGQDGR